MDEHQNCRVCNGNFYLPALLEYPDSPHSAQGFLNTALLVALQRDLTQLGQIIPDQEFFQVLGQQVDANVRANIQRELNNALQNIPTRQQVNDLQVQLQQAIANRDQARANQIADALHQILQLDPVSVQQMQQIKQNTKEIKMIW
jgi:macrodomain Ter protein organizer (MatP/YcbG family)